jgi:hypothetical protein
LAAAKDGAESKAPTEGQGPAEEADGEVALKKQLEAKEAEAMDWKVRGLSPAP